MIKQLMAHFRLTKPISVENVPQIPIDSHEDLDNLEKFLDVKENFEYMVNTLSISGGTTITQITRRIIAKLITNNYATNYNWAGRAPKRAFKSLKTKNLVVATVKAVESNAAINLIENSIKDWLKLSSVRLTLAEARALKRNISTASMD
ncbi:hypothetical protein X777_01849 [Ooceraea biroi]|nr:hypothetical protein X777_01849 [Ooceraea biroi]